MKASTWVAMSFGSLVFVAGLVCFGIAIWTVGPDSGRWAGTGVLLSIVGSLISLAATAGPDMAEDRP